MEFNNDLFMIVQFQHVKPGKGPAFVRTKLKSVTTGRVIENTFTAGVKINVARIERRPFQFLYKDDMGLNFMHQETFEQISIAEELVEARDFLKEGQDVEVVFHADTESVLYCDLPQFVNLKVVYTEPGLRGDTASSTVLKPAELETGASVQVPLFVEIDQMIKVDTQARSYVERVR